MNPITFFLLMVAYDLYRFGDMYKGIRLARTAKENAAAPALPAPAMCEQRARYGESYHKAETEFGIISAVVKFVECYDKAFNKNMLSYFEQFVYDLSLTSVSISFDNYNQKRIEVRYSDGFRMVSFCVPQKSKPLSDTERAEILVGLKRSMIEAEHKMNRDRDIYFNYWEVLKASQEFKAILDDLRVKEEMIFEQQRTLYKNFIRENKISWLDYEALAKDPHAYRRNML